MKRVMKLFFQPENDPSAVLSEAFRKRLCVSEKNILGTGIVGDTPQGDCAIVLDRVVYDPVDKCFSVYARGFKEKIREGMSDFSFVCCLAR